MLNGDKFRLAPSTVQEQILLRWIGCQRLIYHAKVQEARYFRRFCVRSHGIWPKKSRVGCPGTVP